VSLNRRYIKLLLKFRYAWNGILFACITQKSFRIELFIGCIVLFAGLLFQFSMIKWIIVLFLIGIILSAELLNTAIERTCDFVFKGHNKSIKIIKDVSSASVAVLAIMSIIIGLIIFIHSIYFNLLKH
jgi:diacylglycerol kinase